MINNLKEQCISIRARGCSERRISNTKEKKKKKK